MSVSELALSADVERLLSVALRADGRVVALVSDRVYTTWPHNRSDDTSQPCVLITRIGGGPVFMRPLALDACELQVDSYGGRKHASWQLAATVAAVLVELADTTHDEGVVHGVSIDALRYVPDESFTPSRPRYVADVTVTASPPRSSVRLNGPSPVATSEGG